MVGYSCKHAESATINHGHSSFMEILSHVAALVLGCGAATTTTATALRRSLAVIMCMESDARKSLLL